MSIVPVGMPWHYGIGKKPEPVTMQAPEPVRAIPPRDCGCGKAKTKRFREPLPRPEDAK